MRKVIFVASTMPTAKALVKASKKPTVQAVQRYDGYPASPRSIRNGATRGLTDVAYISVDESAWPLPADVLTALEPHHARIFGPQNQEVTHV